MQFDFEAHVYDGQTSKIEVDGFTVTATIHHDDTQNAPWDCEDGHGPVSDWRRAGYSGHASKSPGERPLVTVAPHASMTSPKP